MTHNYDSIEYRIIILKNELKTIIDLFDPFDKMPNVEDEDYLPPSQTSVEKGNKIIDKIDIDENKSSKKMAKPCCIM